MDIARTTGIGIKQDIVYPQKNLSPNKSSSETLAPNKNLNDDIVSISSEAKALLDGDKKLVPDEEDLSGLLEMLERLKESSDSKDNPHNDFLKCIIISMRIMSGDRVPSKDRQFLIENQPEMYLRAILLARQNDKPKKHDSLLEDEEDDLKIDSDASISFDQVSGNTSEESISSDSIELSTEIEE